mgnify:FL=1
MLRVGLAMLQGARHEHAEALRGAAAELDVDIHIVECRRAEHVDETLDALVLPGGESTTMRIASRYESLLVALFAWMDAHPERPVLGTCAGAILLAAPGLDNKPYIDAGISRNAWGRQRDSFEAVVEVELAAPSAEFRKTAPAPRDRFAHQPLEVASQGASAVEDGFPGVFIRAPRFEQDAVGCQTVARLGDEIVCVLDGRRLGVTFHPELTMDRRFHRWLLSEASNAKEVK